MGDFGTNLKRLMEEQRYSVADVAERIGTPTKTVTEWVSRGRVPRSPEQLRALAELFKVSIHKLLFGVEDPNNALSMLLEKTEIHTGLYEISIRKVTPK